MSGRRPHRIGARYENTVTKQAQSLVAWSRGTGIEDAAIALVVQGFAGVLEPRPGTSAGIGRRQVEARELGLRGEVGDVVHRDLPAPQISRHAMSGWQRDLSEQPIPLSPRGELILRKVDRSQRFSTLPTAAGRWCRQPQRICAVGCMPPPRTCSRHTLNRRSHVWRLGKRGLFKGGDQSRHPHVIAACNDIDRLVLRKRRDRLAKPYGDVGGLHHTSESLDQGGKLDQPLSPLTRGRARMCEPGPRRAAGYTRRTSYVGVGQFGDLM